MRAKRALFWFAILVTVATFSTIAVEAAQREVIKLTVGYTPISGATLPFYVALEAKFFQKYGFEVSPVFMGGSPLINSAILAGEFPIGYTGGGAIIFSICVFQLSTRPCRSAARMPTLIDSTMFSLNSFKRSYSSAFSCRERYKRAFSIAIPT